MRGGVEGRLAMTTSNDYDKIRRRDLEAREGPTSFREGSPTRFRPGQVR